MTAPTTPATAPTHLPLTSSQTVGPYLSIGLDWPDGEDVVSPGTTGAVTVRGRLFDGAGEPIPDGIIETWQADPDGRFDSPDDPRGACAQPGFRGYGRSSTRADGSWAIHTLKPGRVPDGEGGLQAPHIDVSVFARGLLDRVITRFYFGDEAEANAEDPVLASLPADRRGTLIAVLTQPAGSEPGAATEYVLDLHLQGEAETVFFTL